MTMKMKSYSLPQNAWYGDKEITIDLPADWDVKIACIPADEEDLLTEEQITEKILNPVGSLPLRDIALGKKKAVIIFDDLSRPTNIAEIAPLVIKELLSGGIEEKKISFVAALGAHGAHTRLEFEKKLGREIVSRFPVYNHNAYENCVFAGKTRSGIPLYFNKEVMDADMKIGIGSILPHAFNGFGGGGKIIMPGISSMETITENHRKVIQDLKDRGVGFIGNMGRTENSKMKEDIEDAVKAVNLDFLINVLPNSSRKPVDITAGGPLLAYDEGVEKAKILYVTEEHKDADIVITNANAKASEALIALLLGANSLKDGGGDLVTVVNCPVGQIVHYLFGQFGENTGGKLWSGSINFPQTIKRSIIFSQCPGQRFGLHNDAIECDSWDKVLELLLEKNGAGSKVVILKDGTMQYLPVDS
jgi:lactate racemase